jgi:hypothetical protein
MPFTRNSANLSRSRTLCGCPIPPQWRRMLLAAPAVLAATAALCAWSLTEIARRDVERVANSAGGPRPTVTLTHVRISRTHGLWLRYSISGGSAQISKAFWRAWPWRQVDTEM